MNGVIPKHGMQLILSSNESNFTVNFDKPLVLDDDVEYAIGLVSLETLYGFPNIEYGKNNKLFYSPDKGSTYFVVNVDTGAYNIDSLSSAIFKKMKANNHYDSVNDKPHIKFHHDKNRCKVIMTLKDGYTIDFRRPNTFRDLLGFGPKIYTVNSFSLEPVKILNVKSIMIHVDVVEGSFVNGAIQPVIYSFSPNVSSKFEMIETPKNIIYVKIDKKYISYINVRITDQDGKLLNLGGENISMRLHIKC